MGAGYRMTCYIRRLRFSYATSYMTIDKFRFIFTDVLIALDDVAILLLCTLQNGIMSLLLYSLEIHAIIHVALLI